MHTFYRPHYTKNKKYLKKHDDDVIITFSGIYYFWGSGVRQKYAVWVIVGYKIKFRIQRALPIEIGVKTQGDMSKIRTKKVVVFFMTNMSIQPLWLTHFIEILLVLEFHLT